MNRYGQRDPVGNAVFACVLVAGWALVVWTLVAAATA
jgi:hypothetical protein